MPFAEMNGLRYCQFESLNTRHAVFTRHGGASPKQWGSLNVGGTVGDDLDRVRMNRQLSFRALDRAPESIFDVWQVHSADVVCAKAPRPEGESVRQADVILTDLVLGLEARGIEARARFLGITDLLTVPCVEDTVKNAYGSALPAEIPASYGSLGACTEGGNGNEDWALVTAILAHRYDWAEGAVRLVIPR